MFTIKNRRAFPSTTGIYSIGFINSNKVYVGSTFRNKGRFRSQRGFRWRWGFHIAQLRSHTHHSIKLQRAYNKYGEDNLYFSILEITDNRDLEPVYMDKFDSVKGGYNMVHYSENSFDRTVPEETKDILRRYGKERRDKLSPRVVELFNQGYNKREIAAILGKCFQTIEVILEEAGMEGYMKRPKPIYEYNSDGDITNIWPTMKKSGISFQRKDLTSLDKVKDKFYSYLQLNRDEFVIKRDMLLEAEKQKKQELYDRVIRKDRSWCKPYVKITQKTREGEIVNSWTSIKEVRKIFGEIGANSIRHVMAGLKKSYKGYLWEGEKAA